MDNCFVDTETTSLSAEYGEIWEFAGIRCTEEGEEVARLEFQIECDLGTADPFSLKIGKYRERFGQYGYWDGPQEITDGTGRSLWTYNVNPVGRVVSSKSDAAKLIEEFTRGTMLWANCVAFDSERMERLLRAWNECPGWHYHVQDIEAHIVGYARARGVNFRTPYSSDELSKFLGVEEPSDAERHTAMGDAQWVKRQWEAIYGS